MKVNFINKYFKFNFSIILFILVSISGFICDQDVSVSPPPPSVSTGILRVQSEPESFTIFLNGRNTGRITPDSLIYLDYSAYQITLKKKYFRDTSITVNITEGLPVDINIDFLSNPLMYGSLNIRSNPEGSEIYLNDSSTAYSTPATISNLIPGLYSITLKKTGFRDADLSDISVESNVIKTIYTELEDTSVWVSYRVFNSNIPTNVLSCITIDMNGTKWIGTYEYGLLKFDGNNFTEYNSANSPLPNNYILCLAVDPSNRLWIGTDNGLAVLSNSSWTIFTKDNSGLPINSIKSLAAESSNLMWIGTSVGLVKYDGNWQVYTISPDVTNWINTISVDQFHTKWLGIGDTSLGVMSFNGTDFTNYPMEEYGYQTKNVMCSAVSPSGQIWFACNPFKGVSGGLSYFDGNSFNNITLSSFLLVNNINISNSDKKWISTNAGLYEITGTSQITIYSITNSPLTSNDIKGTAEDSQGILWIATGTGGLVKFKEANN